MDWHKYLSQVTRDIDDPDEALEVRQELLSHLTLLAEDLAQDGCDKESARAKALHRMGNLAEVRERLALVHASSPPQRVMALYEEELLWTRGLSMVSLLRVEWKRVLMRWQTWAAFAVLLGFFFQGLYAFYRSHVYWAYGHWTNAGVLSQPGHYNAYLAFLNIFNGPTDFIVGILPLLVAVAAGDSLAWDRKSGFVEYVVNRSSLRRYILAKIGSASLVSAGLILGAALISAMAAAVFCPVSSHPVITGVTPMLLAEFYALHPFLYCLMVAGIAALAGMAWTVVGVLLSTLIKNIYLVVAGPWLLFLATSFPLLVFAPHYAPLVLIGPWINTQIGYGAGPGYAALVPLTWLLMWIIGGLSAYGVFLRRATRKGMAA